MPKLMLDGFKVIDFSHVVAGPHCTKILAEYGAEVIKIEPLTGDLSRMLPVHREGRSGYFIQHNVGKKTMAMDLTKPEAQAICHELIRQADIVVENFSPGVMKRHNLDWDTLKKINPNLIMCSISCFGQEGPLSHLPGYDWIGQSYAGILELTGEPDQSPVFGEMALGDVSTGVHAYGAIVTALLHRLRGGGGQHIDISLLEVLFSYHDMNVQIYDASGGKMMTQRAGSKHDMVCPAGIYKCHDRYLFLLAAASHQWEALVKLMGREDMLEDPRYNDIIARGVNKKAVDDIIETWLNSFDSADAALQALQSKRIPSAPILTIPEVMALPHVKERNTVRTVSDPIFGEVKIPRTPLRFSEFPEPPELIAGTLGQHNHQILSEYLSYSTEDIENLEKSGVIISKNI